MIKSIEKIRNSGEKIDILIRMMNVNLISIDYLNAIANVFEPYIDNSTIKYIYDNLSPERKEANLHLYLFSSIISRDSANNLNLNEFINSFNFEKKYTSEKVLAALVHSKKTNFRLNSNSIRKILKDDVYDYSHNHNKQSMIIRLMLDPTSNLESDILNEELLKDNNNYIYKESLLFKAIVLSEKTYHLDTKVILNIFDSYYKEATVDKTYSSSYLFSKLLVDKNITINSFDINDIVSKILEKEKNTNEIRKIFEYIIASDSLQINSETLIKIVERSLPSKNTFNPFGNLEAAPKVVQDAELLLLQGIETKEDTLKKYTKEIEIKANTVKTFIKYINKNHFSDESISSFFTKVNFTSLLFYADSLCLNEKNFNLLLDLFANKNFSESEINSLITASSIKSVISPLKLSKIIEKVISNYTLDLSSKYKLLFFLDPKYLDLLSQSKNFMDSISRTPDAQKIEEIKILKKSYIKDNSFEFKPQNSIFVQKIFHSDIKNDLFNSEFLSFLSNNIAYISSIAKRNSGIEFDGEDQTPLFEVLDTDKNNYKKVISKITGFSFFKKDKTDQLQSLIDDIIIRKDVIANFSNIDYNDSGFIFNDKISNIYSNVKLLINSNFLDLKTSTIKDLDKLVNFDLKSIVYEYIIDQKKQESESDILTVNDIDKKIQDIKNICLEQIYRQFNNFNVEEIIIDKAKLQQDLLVEKEPFCDDKLMERIRFYKHDPSNITIESNKKTNILNALTKYFDIYLNKFNGLHNYQIKLLDNQMSYLVSSLSFLEFLPESDKTVEINSDGLSANDVFDLKLSKINENLDSILNSQKTQYVLEKVSNIREKVSKNNKGTSSIGPM